MRLSYAILFVSDMARSVAFYRDVVGAALRFESPEWTEFSTGDATLALHRGEPGTAGRDARNPSAAGHCRPGFAVEDLDLFHSRMRANDVEVVQEPTEVFGARVAQYLDPDGIVLSVSERRGGG